MLRRRFGVLGAMCVAAFVSALPTRSLADERCHQLEALHAQYAGVELTAYQKQIKRKLVVWYYSHCRGNTVAED